jgi:hypothetical protein
VEPIDLQSLDPAVALVVSTLRLRYGGHEEPAVDGADPAAVLDVARRHGVDPLVLRSVDDAGVSLPAALDAALRQAARGIGLANLDATGELVRLLDLFDGAGIRSLPYKGPVLATVAYGDVGLRRFVDLDLLVDAVRVPEALAVLEDDGYEAAYDLTPRQLRAVLATGHDRKLVKGDRSVVEVQWAVADATNRLPRDVGPLIDRATTVEVAGRQVPTLVPEDLVVVLAIHGSLHLWERLAWICDLAEALRLAAQAGVDAAALVHLATGAGARRMLLLGVALIEQVLATVPLPGLLDLARTDRAVVALSDDLVPIILGDGPHRAPARTQLRLSMGLADRRADAYRKLWRSSVTPTVSDWKTVPLPDALWPLYYPVRLGRLATSYVIGDLRPGDVDLE